MQVCWLLIFVLAFELLLMTGPGYSSFNKTSTADVVVPGLPRTLHTLWYSYTYTRAHGHVFPPLNRLYSNDKLGRQIAVVIRHREGEVILYGWNMHKTKHNKEAGQFGDPQSL